MLDGKPTAREIALANRAVIDDEGVTDAIRAKLIIPEISLFSRDNTLSSVPSTAEASCDIEYLDFRTIAWTSQRERPDDPAPSIMVGIASHGGASFVPMLNQFNVLVTPMLAWSTRYEPQGITMQDWRRAFISGEVAQDDLARHYKEGIRLYKALGLVIHGIPPFSPEMTKVIQGQVSHFTSIIARGIGLIEQVAALIQDAKREQERWREELAQAEVSKMQRLENLTSELSVANNARHHSERTREGVCQELYLAQQECVRLSAALDDQRGRNIGLEAKLQNLTHRNAYLEGEIQLQRDLGQGYIDPRVTTR